MPEGHSFRVTFVSVISAKERAESEQRVNGASAQQPVKAPAHHVQMRVQLQLAYCQASRTGAIWKSVWPCHLTAAVAWGKRSHLFEPQFLRL